MHEGSTIHLCIVIFGKINFKEEPDLAWMFASVDFVGLWRGDSCTVEAIAEHGACLGRLIGILSPTETEETSM